MSDSKSVKLLIIFHLNLKIIHFSSLLIQINQNYILDNENVINISDFENKNIHKDEVREIRWLGEYWQI